MLFRSEQFGLDDHRKVMKAFISLKQIGTVAYQFAFQELVYKASMLNPHYDEQLFISHFIRGLKPELRAAVESQVPVTLERAYLLAQVQQEVWEEGKHAPMYHRPFHHQARPEAMAQKPEAARPAPKLGTGELWKNRQLRDYHRTNSLCFRCGEKYDPTHQCNKKQGAEAHALQLEEETEQLSDEVLNMMELHDIAQAEQLSLSTHAIAGMKGAEALRLRAMLGNQVLIILVDSGSSNIFLNAALVDRLKCAVTTIPSAP